MSTEEKRKALEPLVGKTVVIVYLSSMDLSDTLGTLQDVGIKDAYVETDQGEDVSIPLEHIKKIRSAEWTEIDLSTTSA